MSEEQSPELTREMKKIKLPQILRKLIEAKGAPARQVAREVGIPQSTLNNYLSGRGPTNPAQIHALAQYFGTSMEFLLFGEDTRPPTLDEVFTQGIFDGWLRVKIERAIPSKRKAGSDDDGGTK